MQIASAAPRRPRSPRTGDAIIPAESCLIGIFPQPGYHVVLHPATASDPPVYYADEELADRFADDLEKMLLQTAHRTLRKRRLTHAAAYAARTPELSLAHTCDLAAALGFTREWFSDSINCCLERAGASLVISQFSEDRLMMEARAASADDLRRIEEDLARPLDLTRTL